MPRLELPGDEVHVHWVAIDAVPPALFGTYPGLMNEEERARHDRFLFEPKRREFLVTRALVRTTLAHYAGVDARDFTFRQNPWGRPEIDAPVEHRSLSFNLSNTFGLVAIAIARGREIGIDVEDTQRRGETVGVADRFFSASESAALRALPPAHQRARFFDYWTLKESYIKARGMGLAIPLGDFSFTCDSSPEAASERRWSIEVAPALEDDGRSWQFEQRYPTDRHAMAIAIRRRSPPDIKLVVRETVPLAQGDATE